MYNVDIDVSWESRDEMRQKTEAEFLLARSCQPALLTTSHHSLPGLLPACCGQSTHCRRWNKNCKYLAFHLSTYHRWCDCEWWGWCWKGEGGRKKNSYDLLTFKIYLNVETKETRRTRQSLIKLLFCCLRDLAWFLVES